MLPRAPALRILPGSSRYSLPNRFGGQIAPSLYHRMRQPLRRRAAQLPTGCDPHFHEERAIVASSDIAQTVRPGEVIRRQVWQSVFAEEPFRVYTASIMSTAQSSVKPDAAVRHDIDWGTYTRLLRAFEPRRHFRLTYDRGTLEIRSPLWEHERPAYLLGRFIDVLTDELRMPCEPGRTVTLRRRRKSRGLEPDNCYWIANVGRLAGKTHLDLRVDPPPDLAIEIDITHSSLDRLGIYAALGVPEVWRVTAEGFTFHILVSGVYKVRPRSLSFPRLASADLVGFLARFGRHVGTTALVAEFRDWVRQSPATSAKLSHQAGFLLARST